MDTIRAYLLADEETAMLLRADLAQDESPVSFKWDGSTALETAVRDITETVPDVVLASLDVADSEGLETLEALRAATSAPIVVIGGTLGLDEALKAIRAGAEDVFLPDEDEEFDMVRRARFAVERTRRIAVEETIQAEAKHA